MFWMREDEVAPVARAAWAADVAATTVLAGDCWLRSSFGLLQMFTRHGKYASALDSNGKRLFGSMLSLGLGLLAFNTVSREASN